MDEKFTAQMQSYLATPPASREVAQGALLLFRLNGNAYIYHNAVANPKRYAALIEHELKKYLRIRLDGLTRSEVARMEQSALPRIAETIEQGAPIIDADNDYPKGEYRGRRADHDSLPKEVRALYDKNGDIYYKMKQLYNQLCQMEHAEPCDRYELLKQLKSADERYRLNWAKYDNYNS